MREISLEQDVNVGEGGKIAAISAVAQLRIKLVAQAGVHTILNVEPGGEVGAVVQIRDVSLHLLAKRLSAKVCWKDEELGEVRAERFTGEAPAEQQIRGDLAAAVSGTEISWLRAEFRGCLSR